MPLIQFSVKDKDGKTYSITRNVVKIPTNEEEYKELDRFLNDSNQLLIELQSKGEVTVNIASL